VTSHDADAGTGHTSDRDGGEVVVDGGEVVVRVVLRALGVVDEGGEDDDAENEEEDEQTQLVRARLERLYEDLE